MGDRTSFARSRSTAVARQQPQEQLFDTHPEVSLDFEIVRRAASQKYSRPFLIVDTAIVRTKARRFRAAMPRVRPHYAVKANPDRRVLKVLAQEGCGFEIASTAALFGDGSATVSTCPSLPTTTAFHSAASARGR